MPDLQVAKPAPRPTLRTGPGPAVPKPASIMAESGLQFSIGDFGSSVLSSLNQQRLLGLHCDVSILVQGQVFKAHRAVLAASSLYFRDLFSAESSDSSEWSRSTYELPSSVTPSCFRQILTFCYTGCLNMVASEQLVLMYTAGYLQVQNIVERSLELMKTNTTSSSPHCCDSQTTSADELGPLDRSVVELQGSSPDPSMSPEDLMMAVSRIKQERQDTPPENHTGTTPEELDARGDFAGALQTTRGGAVCYLGAAGSLVLGLQSYLLAGGGRSSSEASSLPTDSSPSQPPTEEEPEDGDYGNATHLGIYQYTIGHQGQEKPEMLRLRRACVVVGGDNMALPASLVSQIGYRSHPALYVEGEPGHKLELVAGSGVFMTRGQLMNCHLCAGVKHKVLLRRLLATFFDRNTLANSCGTGIRSSTNDPSRKPLDNRVLNAVKLYCQNFAPSFKESEMNVIAADMCTNARRVRKRWLPKIQSLLPHGNKNNDSKVRGGAAGRGGGDASEADVRRLGAAPYLCLEVDGEGTQHQDQRHRLLLCTASSSPHPVDTDLKGAEPNDSQ
ncbi:nucleus accumbens-associated protein 2-like [Phycodurus eques]|uniref:nucleus accumbens-associated protein 2-like n=1 Tax=Phycodurus eques TaxID=693459 RepID=UPI002ACEE184|nr:nucleus accumbens-associated protein 2-like [Phycodurus eques]XP_061527204.1 nucleus accumbens-associated protein 2-like [Phycodurus eques]XP_061527205.1 nucleus accumbens-associated protein 2-like [Phycodurus eques]XP_061527206.1 nucleus accumbens-associated protein 2-like [Phycodurus eques]XP_061527207.1 nucleus accumbens-associated protein 2-like [Phycodurus eques]XP_061527208.1 nucleus accumbens-associated protein 2-like [Phycodurus eques]